MSVIRPRLPQDPIHHLVVDAAGQPWGVIDQANALEAIRDALVREPHGLDLPKKLLDEYGTTRTTSRLFAILSEARRLRESIDRLVIVSDPLVASGTRLLVASCCHPFHDQLPRGDRGGRPRLLWLDANADTDWVQGLLDVVAPEGRPRSADLLDQWAAIAVDSPSDEEAIVARTEILVEAMGAGAGFDPVPDRLVAIARAGSRLATFVDTIGCAHRCVREPDLGSALAVFTWPSLLPAAITGINIVRLLEGADAMLVRFAEAPAQANPVLVEAAFRHAAAHAHGLDGNSFTSDSPALAGFSSWMNHAWPAPPARAAVMTSLEVVESRRAFPKTLPMTPRPPTKPHVTIRLPRLDEHSLGQLLQLAILSATVASRLRQAL